MSVSIKAVSFQISCSSSVLCVQVLPFPSQVVYNRVGKCGSRTVVILLRLLAEKHQFNLVSSDIHNKTRLTKHEQVRAAWQFRSRGCLATMPNVVKGGGSAAGSAAH